MYTNVDRHLAQVRTQERLQHAAEARAFHATPAETERQPNRLAGKAVAALAAAAPIALVLVWGFAAR